MAITQSQAHHWGIFPYPRNYSDDRSNNGGIDLTKEPERISEIHELEGLPKLRDAFLSLNTENHPFMTTGFLHDRIDENSLYTGYLEFCFRPNVDFSKVDFGNFDADFLKFTHDKYGKQFSDFYEMELRWEMHTGNVYGSHVTPVFSIYYRSRFHEETEAVLAPVFEWLQSDYQHLLS